MHCNYVTVINIFLPNILGLPGEPITCFNHKYKCEHCEQDLHARGSGVIDGVKGRIYCKSSRNVIHNKSNVSNVPTHLETNRLKL